MKSSYLPSYYMGISYRSTSRPQQNIEIQINTKSNGRLYQNDNENDNGNQKRSKAQNSQEDKNAMHVKEVKNRKRVQKIMKFQTPFIRRKEREKEKEKDKHKGRQDATSLTDYNHKHTHSRNSSSNYTDFIKIVKLEKNRNQIDNINHENVENIQNMSVSVQLPKNKLDRKFKEEQITLERKEQLKCSLKRQLMLNQQKQAIFNHFPSQLFISPVCNSRLSLTRKNEFPTRNASFFFPSNRVKTEPKRNKIKSLTRPNSSIPRKLSKDTKLFNFDGTLQNHRIILPDRPKTAIVKSSTEQKYNHIQYHNFQTIARRCIKLKNKRNGGFEDNDKDRDRGLKIQPWADRENQEGNEIFDVSYSTIRGVDAEDV